MSNVTSAKFFFIIFCLVASSGITQNTHAQIMNNHNDMAPGVSQQVMVTPDSYLEDQHGNEITYDQFIEKMNTGRFMPAPIYDEEGKVKGFRLSSHEEAPALDLSGMNREIKLESTEITESVSLDFIYRDYLFLPVEFFNGEEWISQWMVFDTGTFIPMILLPETAEKVGTVQKIKMGDIEILNPGIGSFEFNDLLRNLNRYRDNHPDLFGEREIAGIAGLPMLTNYLVSLEFKKGKITLRPIDSVQRTLYDKKSVTSVEYRSDLNNIWFPVTINGREGYAHLDTGNPYFDIDNRVIEDHHDFNSFKIDDREIGKYLDTDNLRIEDFAGRYGHVGLDVIAAFGNHAASEFVITIDPREKKLYFEQLRDN